MTPLRITASAIRECFIEAGRRHSIPDDCACDRIAVLVNERATWIGTPVQRPTLGTAKKYARLFLKHLPAARAVVEARARYADHGYFDDPQENPHFDALVEFKMAEHAVSALLKRYGEEKPRDITWHDLANWIALYGEREWKQAGYSARAVNVGDPLCLFVHRALQKVGITKSESAISDALLRKRGPGAKVKVAARKKKGRTVSG